MSAPIFSRKVWRFDILSNQWANVALQSGLKNERVAKEIYRQMTKKFGWGAPGAGSPSGSVGGTASPTPTKVQKRTGKVGTKSAKKASTKKVKEEGEEEVEENKSDENDEPGEDGCV